MTMIKRDAAEMTVGDVLQQVISKRALSTSCEYLLELKGPGSTNTPVELTTKLKVLDIRSAGLHAVPLEFLLVRTHSKRRDLEEGEDGAAQLQGVFDSGSLAQHQTKTYFVSKSNKFTSREDFELVVSADKITLTAFQNRGVLRGASTLFFFGGGGV
jgi:hypothetical protein